jgi:hypothetical protein
MIFGFCTFSATSFKGGMGRGTHDIEGGTRAFGRFQPYTPYCCRFKTRLVCAMKSRRLFAPLFFVIASSSIMALSPVPPLSVCRSDYREVAKQRWLAALDTVDRTTPQPSYARIAALEQEEAPLRQPHLPVAPSENEPMAVREKRDQDLRIRLGNEPDYVAWQIRKQTAFLRRYPAEIDRIGPDSPVDQRFNELDGGIRILLLPLYRDVFRLSTMRGGIDWASDTGDALRAIDGAAESLIDIVRCDTKKALKRPELKLPVDFHASHEYVRHQHFNKECVTPCLKLMPLREVVLSDIADRIQLSTSFVECPIANLRTTSISR